jgi:hypothetical protein
MADRRDLDFIARRDDDPLSGDALFGIDKTDELRERFNYIAVPNKDLEDLDPHHSKTAASVPRAQLERYAREMQENVNPSLGVRIRRFIARVQAAMKLGVSPQELSEMFYGGAPLPDPLRIAGLGYEAEARYLHAAPVTPQAEADSEITASDDLAEGDGVTASMRDWRVLAAAIKSDPRLRRLFGYRLSQIDVGSRYRELDELQRKIVASTLTDMKQPLENYRANTGGRTITAAEEAAMKRLDFGLNRIQRILASSSNPVQVAAHYDRLSDPDWLDPILAADLTPDTGIQPNSPLAVGDNVEDHMGNKGNVTSTNPDGSFDIEYDANSKGVKKTTYDSDAFNNGIVKRQSSISNYQPGVYKKSMLKLSNIHIDESGDFDYLTVDYDGQKLSFSAYWEGKAEGIDLEMHREGDVFVVDKDESSEPVPGSEGLWFYAMGGGDGVGWDKLGDAPNPVTIPADKMEAAVQKMIDSYKGYLELDNATSEPNQND